MNKYRLIDLEKCSQAKIFVDSSALKASGLDGCYLSAIGGRVISDDFRPQSTEVRKMCLEAVGEGSILTFGNPRGRTRKDYAVKAFSDKHLWALRTFFLTFTFINSPEQFRLDTAFCRRFHLSWQEKTLDEIPTIFSAQGSLRDWKKFLKHSEDRSFSKETRIWMNSTKALVNTFLPELFE